MKPISHSLPKLAFWCGLLLLTVLSLLPVDQLPEQIMDIWDKAQHAAGFGVLALLGALAYPSRLPGVSLGLLAYGGFIELAQTYTGWRHGDWQDLMADAVGILMGGLLIAAASRLRQARAG